MNVVWSVMLGDAPTAPVTDPGPLGVAIPEDVAQWAEGHGWGPDSPDVWLAVAPQDPARGAIGAEIAWRDGVVSEQELADIEAQVQSQT